MGSLQSRRELIRHWYRFDFPEDFYRFWEFVNRLKPLNPLAALEDQLGIILVGPFDFLYGKCDRFPPPMHPYLHWRYYLDPPEFFTVLVGGDEGIHWGYYFDSPGSGKPGYMASYYAKESLEFNCEGNTLFKAVRLAIEEKLARSILDHSEGLIQRATLIEIEDSCAKTRSILMNYQTGNRPETGDSYLETYQGKPGRFRKMVAPTLDLAGIVVPKNVYRKPVYCQKAIERMIWRKDGQSKIAREARCALQEGFPGTALQLAKALWVNCETHAQRLAHDLLQLAYSQLNQPILAEILAIHWKNRDRPWLDIFQEQAELN